MIERHNFFFKQLQKETSRELELLSIISQSFFQPFSLEDNLLVMLTALTSSIGVGFNRAMLFLAEGETLKAKLWLGPRAMEEANSIWEVLSTPGIGYAEVINYNRSLLATGEESLNSKIKTLAYSLNGKKPFIPTLASLSKEIIHVKDAWDEPLVDREFLNIIKVDDFLCIPLLGEYEVFGEIIVDNAITHVPISNKDIELARICSLIAGDYIYTTNMHEKMVKMERLAALGEVAMFITHQLRTPVVTIGGFSDQLIDPEISEEQKKRNMQIIRSEIKRLEEIIHKISSFVKVEICEMVPINAYKLLDSILTLPLSSAKSRGIDLRFEMEEDLPLIMGDPVYVREVLVNLIDNALEAVSDGGTIQIQGMRENADWVRVSVKDTGPGIPDSIRNKIFTPFFSTKKSGLGLGLPYVNRVMEACGGRVEVESEEGKGTLFKLFFRAQERSG